MNKALILLIGVVFSSGCATKPPETVSAPPNLAFITDSIGIVLVESPDLPFRMAETETTQAQWERIMGFNPSRRKGPEKPVESVTFLEAARFCALLSKQEGRHYRLPTEKEWDEACVTGTDAKAPIGVFAWCYPYSSGPRDVATKLPDRHGIYDLYGNVSEWCLRDVSEWETVLAVRNGDDASRWQFDQIAKGGSYLNGPLQCGTEGRVEYGPGFGPFRAEYIGFRVICDR